MEYRTECYCGVPNARSISFFAQVRLCSNLLLLKMKVNFLRELLSFPAAMSARSSVQIEQEGIRS